MSSKNIKCPVDGRLFATKKALKQHNVDAHANSTSRPRFGGSAAVQKGRKARRTVGKASMGEAMLTASGTDLVGTVTISDTDKAGKLLIVWDVNPTTLRQTRLAHLASTFARWRPKKMVFSAHPGMGVLTPGSYCMGWVADPGFSAGDTSTRLQRIMTLSPSILSSFGTPQRLVLPMNTTQKWYFCQGGDEKETTHGQVLAVLAGLVGGKNLTINFRVDWTIEFSSAEIPSSALLSETYPDPMYLPIFTDSVSDWAGGAKLTFKHKDGGSVVPWIGARSDMVYTPASGVKIPYMKADKSQGAVSHFAVIGGNYPSGMACFPDEASAKAYVKTKDFSKALDYVGDGSYTTPILPTLQGKEVEEVGLDLRMSTLRMGDELLARTKAFATYDYPALNFRGGPPGEHPKLNLGPGGAQVDAQYSLPSEPHLYLAAATSGAPGLAFKTSYGRGDPGGQDASSEFEEVESVEGEC